MKNFKEILPESSLYLDVSETADKVKLLPAYQGSDNTIIRDGVWDTENMNPGQLHGSAMAPSSKM
jgi:hypothetical protein